MVSKAIWTTPRNFKNIFNPFITRGFLANAPVISNGETLLFIIKLLSNNGHVLVSVVLY